MPIVLARGSLKRLSHTVILSACLMLTAVGASAVDLPDLKVGLWQMTIQHATDNPASAKPATANQCLDAKTQAAAKQTALDYVKKNCSKNETRQDGARWVTDMVCKLNGKTTMTTHSVTTFGGDTYHTEMTTTFEPPAAGQAHSGTIVDGKWLGACKGT